MILLAASMKDLAGMNIAQKILEHYDFEETSEVFHEKPVYLKKLREGEAKLIFVKEEPVYTQYLTDFFAPQLIIFVSRHASLSGIPTLSVHTPGNLSKAELGGIAKKVSVSPANAMKNALLEMAKMKEEKELDYQVSYECTHHGPSLDVPTMFVELGSSPTQWKDLKAAEAVAHAAMTAILKESNYPASLGIGGPHYNMKFTKMALNTRKAFGHMIPKYAIPQLDAEIVKQCVERTKETVESAVLDWKGIKGADKARITKILDEIGVPIEKV
jgi:D-aminoacyl-tRNA deacylase